MGNVTITDWIKGLTQFISTALSDFRVQTSERMEQFAVDCNPWNGSIILAFLTTAEVEESPFLLEVKEMAAWKHYDFASVRSSTNSDVGQWMQDTYHHLDNKSEGADLFFQGCADVMASQPIRDILAKYYLSKTFKTIVSHPDTGKEYYSGVRS